MGDKQVPGEVQGIMVVEPYICGEGNVDSAVIKVLLLEWLIGDPCCFFSVCGAASHECFYG